MFSSISKFGSLAKSFTSVSSDILSRGLSTLPKINDLCLSGLETKAGNSEWTKLTEEFKKECSDEGLGRLFAVVHAAGKQRKVTTEDIVVLDKFIEADIGDKIRLNKVLMIGSNNFSLFGRPILKPDVASVEATVIEKSLSHNKVLFWYRKRKNSRFFKLRKVHFTYLRINNINLKKEF